MKALIPTTLFVLSFSAMANVYQLIDTKAKGDISVMENGSDVSVQFHISQVQTEASDLVPFAKFESLKFNELSASGDAGTPALPYHSILVKGLPQDIEVNYDLGKAVSLDGVIPAPVAPEKFRCSDCAQPELTVDWSSYAKNSDQTFKKEYLGDFRGTPLTRVSFYPASFVSEKEMTVIYPEATFEVRSALKGKLDTLVMPSEIVTEADLNKNYLIVSPEKFVTALKPFVDWKSELGYEVEVVTLESIGTTAEQVRDFIQAKYNKNAFTYAVLVGHEKNFPTFYRRTSSSYRTPTDLPYFAMGGDNDFIPEVFYGRIIADKVEEVERQVAKTIEYEKADYVDASGLKRSIGMASNEGSNPSDVEYVKAMLVDLDSIFGIAPTYFMQSNSDSTPVNVNALMSKGVAWVNYIGHGSGTSWPSQRQTYSSSDIKNINSAGKVKPIIIDVACMNGNFTYGRNLGVTFMTEVNNGEPTGAVAYYGGSVNISWHPPAIMAVGLNRIVAAKKVSHLGEALLAGQMYLAKNHSSVSQVTENMVWYHLFGDPSLKLNLK